MIDVFVKFCIDKWFWYVWFFKIWMFVVKVVFGGYVCVNG